MVYYSYIKSEINQVVICVIVTLFLHFVKCNLPADFYKIMWLPWGHAQTWSHTLYHKEHWVFGALLVCSTMSSVNEHHFLEISLSMHFFFCFSLIHETNNPEKCHSWLQALYFTKQTFCSLALYCHATVRTLSEFKITRRYGTLIHARETVLH